MIMEHCGDQHYYAVEKTNFKAAIKNTKKGRIINEIVSFLQMVDRRAFFLTGMEFYLKDHNIFSIYTRLPHLQDFQYIRRT